MTKFMLFQLAACKIELNVLAVLSGAVCTESTGCSSAGSAGVHQQ